MLENLGGNRFLFTVVWQRQNKWLGHVMKGATLMRDVVEWMERNEEKGNMI